MALLIWDRIENKHRAVVIGTLGQTLNWDTVWRVLS